MGLKYIVGAAIEKLQEGLIRRNHRYVPFIPNGRIAVLDLKRAAVDPKVIFDVGGNEGQTANYYARHFKNADIYTFEPVKSVYDKMVLATAGNKRIRCFRNALGSEQGEAKIYKSANYNGVSSLNGANNTNLPDEETIEVITGLSVVEKYDISTIDILKIDTEGFEISVLDGLKPMLKDHVKFIYIEAGFDINNNCQTYVSTLLNYLAPYGFTVSGLYSMFWHGASKLKLSHCDILLTNTGLVAV
ncbi:FkbM family methyltransferase [Mucilaginibacter conchicola]|uniref:FkbM family methyltransferase n=1 Tax=Mucilaginibacter conchicola TaxID=2303333 RepID=A0A372NSI3_9SPHI|nr:FkbM family methyltransferase [Mucilaginibacter conchicola]RFZ91934.1 FkbM family methyltransferase [Mucilaginibacter conchicola]